MGARGYIGEMGTLVAGLLTLIAGLLLCFGGYLAMRLLLALWGGYVGFVAGAVGFSMVSGEPLLAGSWSWLVAIAVAVTFALLSYAFYAAAVIIAVGGVGYALGAGVASAAGLGSGAAIFLGLAAAALLVWLSLAARLPHLILAVVSALAGAGIALDGLMLLVGVLDPWRTGTASLQTLLVDQWWWTAGYLVLAIAGIVVQLRSTSRRDLRSQYPAAQPR